MSEEKKTFDEDYVKELRAEAAKYRTQLREAETKLESFSSREKALTEKEIIAAAKAAGAVDPQTLLKLIDTDSLVKGEDGSITNLDEVVNNTLTEKPFLKGGTTGRPSNPANHEGQPRTFTKADLEKMSQSEINENWAEIETQMSKGLIR